MSIYGATYGLTSDGKSIFFTTTDYEEVLNRWREGDGEIIHLGPKGRGHNVGGCRFCTDDDLSAQMRAI